MKIFSRLDRHSSLVKRMARALGVDHGTTLLAGEIEPADFRLQVVRCTGCSDPDGCEQWLDALEGPVSDTPEFCRNRVALSALARK